MHISHFFGHISGTGSRHHIYFKLNLWTHCSFQTSPKLSKSIEPSPRKKCGFEKGRPKNHISGYISETGSHRHIYFKLINGHTVAFKRVQGCPNRLSHLRERNVSSRRAGIKITFPVISPDPQVSAIIRSNLIDGTTRALK